MSTGGRRHIVLVGLPGSGKSSVGPLVACALGAEFVDLDHAIERTTGVTIPELFAAGGETRFRALERAEMERVLRRPPCVVAAGGGWSAQPGNLEAAEKGLLVYLAVPSAVAAERASRAPGVRPLLESRRRTRATTEGDALAPRSAASAPRRAMAELLAARAAYYERCQSRVDAAGGDPATVAGEIVKLARSLAGW